MKKMYIQIILKGQALGVVLGMAALAIMLVAGSVPHRSSSRSCFLFHWAL